MYTDINLILVLILVSCLTNDILVLIYLHNKNICQCFRILKIRENSNDSDATERKRNKTYYNNGI